MAKRRLIVLPERATQHPIEIPKSLQKKKTIKNIDSVIEECKKITEKYAGRYICIDDKDVLIDYIDHILANKRAGLDTETTGLDIFNDKVIGFSLFTPGMKACYVPMLHISRFTGQVDPHQLNVEFCAQQLQRLRIPKMELDYFNAPFDMNMIMYSMGVNLWDILTQDGSLMMRLLNTERHRDNNLKALHSEFCGERTRGPRFNELFPNGSFNVCPYRYAATYAARDAEMAFELVDYANEQLHLPGNEGLLSVWETIERPLIPVLLKMRQKGVLVDQGLRAELTEKYKRLRDEAEQNFIHEYEPYLAKINQYRVVHGREKGKHIDIPVKIGSDEQIKVLFWDIMNLPHEEGAKADKEAIKGTKSKIGAYLLQYRQCTKLLSTYLEGIEKFIQPDGCVHGGIKQLGADTGRTSACIAEGTLIECPGESKPIEQVKVGDEVYTYDDAGNLCVRKVTRVLDNGYRQCMTLKWQSSGTQECGLLTCTPDHMIKTKDAGWVMADHLKPRQKVFHLRARETDTERVISGTNSLYCAEHHWLKFNYFMCEDSSLHIHHKDDNHKNNRLANLIILDGHDHLSLHGNLNKDKECCRGVGKYLGKMTDAQKAKYRATRRQHAANYFNEHGYAYQGLPDTRETWLGMMDKVDWLPSKIPHDFWSVLKNLRMHRINYIDEYRKRAAEKHLRYKSLRLQPVHINYALELADGDAVVAAGFFGVSMDKFTDACEKYNISYNHMILSASDAGMRHVYDLEVEDTHCYIAGEICVHNCDPNMQNIPSHNREIRQIYHARPGCYLISCDYSAQEPRITASLSQDPKMIQAYKDGLDLYSMIAAVAYNTTYEECLEKRNGELYVEGKERRASAKSIVLGICYGRSIPSIAEQLKCTTEEAQLIYDKVTKGFPGLLKAQDDSAQQAHDLGYVITLWGRRRHLSVMTHDDYEFEYAEGANPEFDPFDPDSSISTTVVSPRKVKEYTDKLNSLKWRKDKEAFISELRRQGIKVTDYSYKRRETGRKCLNARIQGSAADMSKRAMIMIDNDERLKKINTYLLLMIHDEVICECPKEHVAEAIRYIKEDMEHAAAELPVPFKADAETAECWYGSEIEVNDEGEIVD